MYCTGHRKFNILPLAIHIFNITANRVPLLTLYTTVSADVTL